MSAISSDVDTYVRDILELPRQVLQERLIAAGTHYTNLTSA